jgi:hypothetical protein
MNISNDHKNISKFKVSKQQIKQIEVELDQDVGAVDASP